MAPLPNDVQANVALYDAARVAFLAAQEAHAAVLADHQPLIQHIAEMENSVEVLDMAIADELSSLEDLEHAMGELLRSQEALEAVTRDTARQVRDAERRMNHYAQYIQVQV